MERRPPIPSRMSKAHVHRFAEKVAEGLSFGPGDLLEPIVKTLGGVIGHHDFVAQLNGLPEAIVVEPDGRFAISMTNLTSEKRDRFTIAHELGHRLVHFPIFHDRYPDDQMVATRWVDETDPEQQRVEWEANWFAAAFLMPEKGFLASVHHFGLDRTAVIYGVSKKAADVRWRSLQ